MTDSLKQFLDALTVDQEGDAHAAPHDLYGVLERLDGLERRISRLEAALPLYVLEDPAKHAGLARKLSELRNTISQVIYPRVKPASRSSVEEAERLREFVNSNPAGFPPPESARLFVDMTGALMAAHVTGIQRVVRELAGRAGKHDGIPVCLGREGAVAYDPRKDSLRAVVFKPGDVFFMPDLPMTYISGVQEAMADVRAAGGRNVALVHDLIPLLFVRPCSRGRL